MLEKSFDLRRIEIAEILRLNKQKLLFKNIVLKLGIMHYTIHMQEIFSKGVDITSNHFQILSNA